MIENESGPLTPRKTSQIEHLSRSPDADQSSDGPSGLTPRKQKPSKSLAEELDLDWRPRFWFFLAHLRVLTRWSGIFLFSYVSQSFTNYWNKPRFHFQLCTYIWQLFMELQNFFLSSFNLLDAHTVWFFFLRGSGTLTQGTQNMSSESIKHYSYQTMMHGNKAKPYSQFSLCKRKFSLCIRKFEFNK